MNALQEQLQQLGACPEAVEWAADFNSINEAWNACPRGDWLLWLGSRLGYNRKDLVLAACDCARLALPCSQGESPLQAINAAERWTVFPAQSATVESAAATAEQEASKFITDAEEPHRDLDSSGTLFAAAYAAHAAGAAARAASCEDAPYASATAARYAVYALEVVSEDHMRSRHLAFRNTADLVRRRLTNDRISGLLASHTLLA